MPRGCSSRSGLSGAGVLELRRRLALDSGYLSRLLRGLEDEGLVEVRRDPADQRRRLVVPTAAGRRAIDRLEDRSEERAADLVGPLGPSQRRRLSEALATRGAADPSGDGRPWSRWTCRRRRPSPPYAATSPSSTSASPTASTRATPRRPTRRAWLLRTARSSSAGWTARWWPVEASSRTPRAIGEIKRMWVDARVARLRARSPDARGARGRGASARLPRGLPRHQQHAGRGDRDVRAVRLPRRSSATTTTRSRGAGSPSACRAAERAR